MWKVAGLRVSKSACWALILIVVIQILLLVLHYPFSFNKSADKPFTQAFYGKFSTHSPETQHFDFLYLDHLFSQPSETSHRETDIDGDSQTPKLAQTDQFSSQHKEHGEEKSTSAPEVANSSHVNLGLGGGREGKEGVTTNPLPPHSSRNCFRYPPAPSQHMVSHNDCKAPYVLMNDRGRLGNNMCQYVCLYLLRHLYGVRVSITATMKTNLTKIFENLSLPVQTKHCHHPKKPTNITYEKLYEELYQAGQRPKDKVTSLLSRSYYVNNHPCPRDLILKYRDQARKALVFRKDVLVRAKKNIDRALLKLSLNHQNNRSTHADGKSTNNVNVTLKNYNLSHNSISISSKEANMTHRESKLISQDLNVLRQEVTIVTVHVRRTDYTQYIMECYNLTSLNQLYFHKAFDHYRQRLRRPMFLVVSDDQEWCQKELAAPDVIITGNSDEPVLDMALLSLGEHIITSYGTFSFLGATLGRGNITHPISARGTYKIFECQTSPHMHFIDRDKK